MDASQTGPRLPEWGFAILGAVTTIGAGLLLTEAEPGSNLHILTAAGLLAALPFVTLWFRTGERRTALLAMWIGAVSSLLLGGSLTSGAVAQAMMLLLMPSIGLPLLLGAICQALLQEAGTAFDRTHRLNQGTWFE